MILQANIRRKIWAAISSYAVLMLIVVIFRVYNLSHSLELMIVLSLLLYGLLFTRRASFIVRTDGLAWFGDLVTMNW